MKIAAYIRNLFKLIVIFFKGQAHNRRVARATGSTIKRTGTKYEDLKKYTNAEKLYDWLAKNGYTKYVHPRGIYADHKPTGEITPSNYRLFIMNQGKLKEDAQKNGKAVLIAERPNKWGIKPIIQVGNKKTVHHPDNLEEQRQEQRQRHQDKKQRLTPAIQ